MSDLPATPPGTDVSPMDCWDFKQTCYTRQETHAERADRGLFLRSRLHSTRGPDEGDGPWRGVLPTCQRKIRRVRFYFATGKRRASNRRPDSSS